MDYRIIYSDRKTLSIEVTAEAEIVVRSPKCVSKRKIEKILFEKKNWLEKAVEKQKLRMKSRKIYTEAEIDALRQKALEIIPKKVEYYSRIIGVSPVSVKITAAKTRFGSCSGKNSLCFSLYLADYPDEAVDYVVVHELCHILEHNHSKRFWKAVEKYLPDYKTRQQLLKNN